ncbi:MAG: metal-dependent hydrolase [Balneolaceae bacterium]
MDSITQMTLGAAVGEAVLGKRAGYRAALWGVALGTLPDLDILINPFVDAVNELYYHRNITHSFFFAVAASPLLGWMIAKVHPTLDAGWKQWAHLSFWVILTHILIDLPTTYGTQIFQPFSNYPAATDSVFIIDPLFTIPVLIGVLTARILRSRPRLGRIANGTGLALGFLYLLIGLGIKAHVHSVYKASFDAQYGWHERLKASPNGPTTFLWNGYVMKQDTVYHAMYSIFDGDTNLTFTPIPRNSHLIEPFQDDRAVEALLWFSRGYYSAKETEDGDIIVSDLRFGRDDFWLTDEGVFVWQNRLIIEDGTAVTFDQSLPSFDVRARNLALFWNRIWGK